jgi:hypothetical protein
MPDYLTFMDDTKAAMPDGPPKAALGRVINLHRDIEAAKAANYRNRDLSPEGQVKSARETLKKTAADLVRANLTAKRLAGRIEEKRASLKLPEIEKTDVASAMARAQARDRLNGKSAKEIAAMVPTMSLLQLQAIVEAPELAGVNANVAEAARNRAIEIVHPGRLAVIDAELDAVRLLQNATNALYDAAGQLADMPSHALTDFVNQAVPDTSSIERDVEIVTA